MQKSNHFEEGTVNVANVKLYYKVFGKGEPVVILHGGPGGDHNLMLPMQEIADIYKVIFYDQRATGNSTGELTSNSINVESFIEDLEALRKELDLSKIHLIGHSWGAVLGMLYAIKYSENLNSLTIFGTGGASAEYFPVYFENFKKNTSLTDQDTIEKIKESEEFKNKDIETYKRFSQLFFKTYFKNKSFLDSVNFTFGKNTINNQMDVANLIMQDLGNFNFYDKLSSITCPTLIIHGELDLFSCEGAYKTYKHIPQSKLIILKDAGHLMFIDSKDKFFSIFKSFLKDDKSVQTQIPVEIEEKLKSTNF